MKRLLILLLILCAGEAWAFPPGFMAVATSGGAAGDYCSGKLGSYSLYYDADHPDGSTKACISGGITTVTLNGVSTSSSYNTTSGGTYGIAWDGTQNKSLAISTSGIMSSTNGRIAFKYTTPSSLPASTDSLGLFDWYTDDNNTIFARLQGNTTSGFRIAVIRVGNSSSSELTGTYVSLSTSTAYDIVVDFKSSTGNILCKLGSQQDSISGQTINSFTSEPSTINFGENHGYTSTGTQGYDDIYLGGSQQ